MFAGQVEFLDVRVFNPNANRYVQSLSKTYKINKKEKRVYNARVQETKHVSFTSIVMSATSGVARECSKFYTRLSVINHAVWSHCGYPEFFFSFIRSIAMGIQGSGSVTLSNDLLKSTTSDTVASEVISNIVLVWIYEHFPFFSTWSLWLGKNSCKFMVSPPRRRASCRMNKMSWRKEVIRKD